MKWKKQLPDSSSKMFVSGKGLAPDREPEIKVLQSKIGEIMCSLRGCGEAGREVHLNGYESMDDVKQRLCCFLECLRIYLPLVFLKSLSRYFQKL